MPFTATCMDLEIVILSEVSQTEKDKYHFLQKLKRKNQAHRKEIRLVRGNWMKAVKRYKFPVIR